MERLMQPDQLRARILLWAEEEIRLDHLPAKSGSILEAVLYRGELPRGDVRHIVGTGERQARRVVSAASRTRGADVRKHARAAAPCLPSCTRLALDAGIVPGKDGLTCVRSAGFTYPTFICAWAMPGRRTWC